MSSGGAIRRWRKKETRVCEVELPQPKECPVCGARGLHGCTGNPDTPNVIYVGKRSAAKQETPNE